MKHLLFKIMKQVGKSRPLQTGSKEERERSPANQAGCRELYLISILPGPHAPEGSAVSRLGEEEIPGVVAAPSRR